MRTVCHKCGESAWITGAAAFRDKPLRVNLLTAAKTTLRISFYAA